MRLGGQLRQIHCRLSPARFRPLLFPSDCLGDGVIQKTLTRMLPYPCLLAFRSMWFCATVAQFLRIFFPLATTLLRPVGRSFCWVLGQSLPKAACQNVGMGIKTRLQSLPMRSTPVCVQRTERTIEPVRTKRCGWGELGGNRARSEHGFNRLLGAPPDRFGHNGANCLAGR
jgi:hypothetical protein